MHPPTPLYEHIHKSRSGEKDSTRVPDWMRSAAEMENITSAATPTAPGSASTRPRWIAWWFQPVRFRLQLGVLLLALFALLSLVAVAFLAGRKFEEQAIYSGEQDWNASERTLESARQQGVDAGLIPSSVPRNQPVPSGSRPPSDAVAAGSPLDPREPGMNYLRLVTLPTTSNEEGLRARAYLQENGVDATLVPVNNGRSVKLLALPGFARTGSPECEGLLKRIKILGRAWKAEHRGSSDWGDAYPEKYKPGIN